MVTDSNLGNLIVVLIGAITALIAAFVTAYKTVRETDANAENKKAADIRAEAELELKATSVKTDISEKIQDIYGQMTDDFNKKIVTIREEMSENNTRYKDEIRRLQETVKLLINDKEVLLKELELSKKAEKVNKEACVLLISAIEQSLELRKIAANEINACKACVISDRALLKILNEVKILFQEEIDNG